MNGFESRMNDRFCQDWQSTLDVNEKDECLRHVLPQAFMSENYELMEFLYDRDADPNQSHGWEDYIWLEWHVQKGNKKAVRWMFTMIQIGLNRIIHCLCEQLRSWEMGRWNSC